MSKFTEEMFATAESSERGLVTGEPDQPLRQSWGEIHRVARAMAGTLADAGIGRGDAIGILAGQPVDIAPACQATWMRGGSVTMLHQPTPRTDLAVWGADTETVVRMIEAKAVILGAPFDVAAPILEERGITVLKIEDMRSGTEIDPIETAESDIALQQLTSGSTGSPKAVRITHENFYVNAYAMIDRIKFDVDSDVMVSWLPLFHDMGMVGFLTVPMQVGAEVVSITPLDFLRSPLLWAKLIDKYRGTVTAAPNFAYSLLARRLSQADDDLDLDLSTLRYAWNGAEPVDPETMATLAEAGAPYKLDPLALAPVYGMAETTLAVSIPDPGQGQVIDIVDADLLEAMARAVEEFGYTFPYLFDEAQSIAKAYEAACTPDFFLFDQERRLVYRGQFDGSRPGNDVPVTGADLEAAVEALAAGDAISLDQKPSIGCNIKWKAGNAPDYFG